MKQLETARELLSYIDRQIVLWLMERMQLSHGIGHIKRREEIEVYNSTQEAELMRRVTELGTEVGLRKEFVIEIYRLIHEESVRIQRRVR